MTRLRDWRFDRRIGRWYVEANPGDLPLPRISWDWNEEPGSGYLSIALGDSFSDPVVGVNVDLTLPRRLAALVGWWGSCRECGVWLGLARSQTHAWTCSRYHLRSGLDVTVEDLRVEDRREFESRMP